MELKTKLSPTNEYTFPEDVEVFPTSRGETIVLSRFILPAADEEQSDLEGSTEDFDDAEGNDHFLAQPPLPATAYGKRHKWFVLRAAWNTVQLIAIGLTLGLLAGAWDELYAQGLFRGPSSFSDRQTQSSGKSGSAATGSAAAVDYIAPRFGPEAMAQCTKSCPASSGEACINGCSRLAYTQYGRRISLTDLDPSREGEEIVASCMNLAPEHASARSRRQWQHITSPALTALRNAQLYTTANDGTALAQSFKELRQASSALQNAAPFDGEGKAFTGLLQRALCLRAQLTQTELAISIVENNNDAFSSRFFHAIRGRIGPRALEAEGSAFSRADEMRLTYEKK